MRQTHVGVLAATEYHGRQTQDNCASAAGPGSVTVVPVSQLLTNTKTDNPGRPAVNGTEAELSGSGTYDAWTIRVGRSRLWSTTAASWYLSLAFHIIGYAVSALIFGWLGLRLIPDQPDLNVPLIQASLDNEIRFDDLPTLRLTPAVGPRTEEATQSLQQLANHLAVSDRGQRDTVVTDARLATTGNEDSDAGDEGDSPFFRIPESGLAVTKGSFTAWTDPAHPEPGQFYQIIIEMRLPDRIKRYRLSDLSGAVIGTDRYRQSLPFDQNSPGAARVTGGAPYKSVRRNTIVNMTGTKLQLAIRVPGAPRLVKDRIRIKSRRLREEQELVLVFGSSSTTQ